MSPLRLALKSTKSIYDVLPSRTNLQKWGIVQDASSKLCGCSLSLRPASIRAHTPLPMGATYGDKIKSCRSCSRRQRSLPSKACSQANVRETAPTKKYFITPQGREREPKKGLTFQTQRLGSQNRPARRKTLPQGAARERQAAQI